MSYESKYIKYKLKYLKLCLQMGGVEEIINWPEDYKKINQNDFLVVVEDDNFNKSFQDMKNKRKELNQAQVNDDNRYITKGKARQITKNQIELYNNDAETIFYFNEFPSGIRFERKNENQNEKQEEKSEGNNANQNKEEKQQELSNQKPNTEESSNLEKIQKQIKELEKRQNELERKLDNHYHVLPTSGMKQFEELHPYYNEKID